MYSPFFPDDHQFDYETQRALGHASFGGAEPGEVLATTTRIEPGDYDGWYDAWFATATRVEQVAAAALAAGHRVTARDGYLRASNYFRSAEFFLHGDPKDPRIDIAQEASAAAFRQVLPLLDYQVEEVEIPYEGVTLRGFYYRAPGDGRHPLVVMHNGFDGSVEEMHFFGAVAAIERGMDALSFDGPGQPTARRRDGLAFRPDWENVVTPVLDWVLSSPYAPGVDVDRVSLLGISMGGLLAPRAAAFEDRLHAVLAVDGVYDLGEISTRSLPMSRPDAEQALRAPSAPELDAALEQVMAANPTARWSISHGMYVMDVATPREFAAAYLDYSLAGGIAERIRTPVLVAEAQSDLFFAGQAKQLYDHLTGPKELMLFTDDEGAGLHCHNGAQRLAFGRILDWLETAPSRG